MPAIAVEQVGSLRDQAEVYLAQRKADAARAVSDIADAFRVTSANLDDFPLVQTACDRIAHEVGGLAAGIANRTPDEIAHEVGAAIRRRPGVAVAAAVTVGVAFVYLARRPDLRRRLRPRVKLSNGIIGEGAAS